MARVAHWLTALCFITLIATGAALYIPALVGLVGRRVLVTRIHVDVGLALPLPLLVSLLGPWGRALRADIRRLNRWIPEDREWLRRARRRQPTASVPTGKFNAGQKLNAAFVLGEMVVMLMTGSVMHWFNFFSNSWRTGATFVHDLFAYLLVAVVLGHVFMAVTHPEALRSIFTGRVSRAWARRHAQLWLEEVEPGSREVPGLLSKEPASGVDASR
ncbi:MAG TPA: cytochrome b/b6 domain-containing protein [Acidimicrobiales bacterium]|nr:cytochrome b/b6 domain-containing protein [Acidimicrobiales bacterium]